MSLPASGEVAVLACNGILPQMPLQAWALSLHVAFIIVGIACAETYPAGGLQGDIASRV